MSRPTQAEVLLALVEAAGVELWATPEGKPYITLPIARHREHHPLGARGSRDWLSRLYYCEEKRPPSAQALQDAQGVLRGKALYEGERHDAPVRYASHDGAIYLDLGDAEWRAVEIECDGWRVVSDPPVRFRRPPGLLSLPNPSQKGDLSVLRELLNVDELGWKLICGWLVGTMAPAGPYLVLSLNGEAGSAKSTAALRLRDLTDPNAVPLRSEPRSERDLAIAAANGRIIALDNVSRLSDSLSDALCRASTGGGFATRELYSDSDELLLHYVRPTIITGITEVVTRGDLADRASVVTLAPISDRDRRTEADLATRWAEVQPIALGGLLDATVTALRRLPEVNPARLPRLADHVRWVTAAEPALGWESGTYLEAFAKARVSAQGATLERSPLTEPLRAVAEEGFEGNATELLAALARHVPDSIRESRFWPRSARSLSGALRDLAPSLRADGIDLGFLDREGNRRPIILQIRRDGDRHDRHYGQAENAKRTTPHDANDGSDAAQATRSGEARPVDLSENIEVERLERKFDIRGDSA